MYLASVVVGFGCFDVVRPFEITEIIWRSDMVMYCGRELPGTTFAMLFPENNCTP